MKKMIFMTTALMLTLALILSGCAPQTQQPVETQADTTAAQTTAATTEKVETTVAETTAVPAEEKVLKVGMSWFGGSLDPATAWDGWTVMRVGLGETLVFISEDMQATPWLAKAYQQREDGNWEFTINDAVTFQNGKALTADAVAKSLQRSLEVNERAAKQFAGATFSAEGDKLVVVTEAPNPVVPEMLSDPMYIIVDVDAEDMANAPVCTGPFMVAEFTTDEFIKLVPYDGYYNGKSPLSAVEFVKVADKNAALLALQAGDIDVAPGLAAAQTQVLDMDDNFKTDRVPSLRIIYALLNPQNEFLSNADVRKALNMAVDKQSLAEKQLSNTLLAGDGPYPPTMPFGKDDVELYAYDVEAAKALLEGAGFADGDGDGILEKDGKPLTLRVMYYTSRGELPIIAQFLQNEYKKIGVATELMPFEKAPEEQMAAGDFDIAFYSFSVAVSANPQTLLDNAYVKDAPGNFNNYYSNPEIDAIAESLKTEGDVEKRIELGKKAEQLIVADGLNIFFGYPQNSVSRAASVSNFYSHPIDFYYLNNRTDK